MTFGGFISCGIILGAINFGIGGRIDFRIGIVAILVGARFAGDSFGAIICA